MLDPRVSRGIAVTQLDIKSVLLSGNDIWRLGFRTISPACLANDDEPVSLG